MDLFHFDKMITPKIITLVYWLMLASAIVGGFAAMFGGRGGLTFGQFVTGLGIMGGGCLSARITCELVIVLFKIHESAQKIAQK